MIKIKFSIGFEPDLLLLNETIEIEIPDEFHPEIIKSLFEKRVKKLIKEIKNVEEEIF